MRWFNRFLATSTAVVSALISVSAPAAAQSSTSLQKPQGAGSSHTDLILIIDKSGSMAGAGGMPAIFPAVQATAKELVASLRPGDLAQIIFYGSDVVVQSPTVIYGEDDRRRVDSQIDAIKANGKYTFTAKALYDAIHEATRLETAQGTTDGTPHRKVIVLLTDGVNEPPPGVNDASVDLSSEATQARGMPWYVWQVQLGPRADPMVDSMFAKRPGDKVHYERLDGGTTAQRLDSLETEMKRVVAVPTTRPLLQLRPASLTFMPLRARQAVTASLKVSADDPSVRGQVRLRPGKLPTGVQLVIEPSVIASGGSMAEAHVTLRVADGTLPGPISGQIFAEPVEAILADTVVTWRVEVQAPSKLPRILGVAAALLAALALIALLLRARAGRIVQGQLEYSKSGGPRTTCRLGELRKQRVTIGDAEHSDVPLAGAGASAVISMVDEEGQKLCYVQKVSGDLQHAGRPVSQLTLYNRDTFLLGSYNITYTGDVAARPRL